MVAFQVLLFQRGKHFGGRGKRREVAGRAAEMFPAKEHLVESGLAKLADHVGMPFVARRPQFQHIAQDDGFRPDGQGRKIGEGSLHAGWIGIVRIDNQRIAVGFPIL